MKLIKKILKFLIGSGKLRSELHLLNEYFIIRGSVARHRKALKKLKGSHEISMVYLATHASTWKYDRIYARFSKDQRFKQTIVVCPLIYNDDAYLHSELEKTYSMLSSKKYNVVKGIDDQSGELLNVRETLKPDIVFFSSPWYIADPAFVINNFLDCLTCYSPYGFYMSNLSLKAYTTFFHAVLWKNFLETGLNRKMYLRHGRRPSNGVVTGSPAMDILTDPEYEPENTWKKTGKNLKRIIWAPHHSIREDGGEFDFSSFLKFSDFMLSFAARYSDRIQFAFKPHPLLRNKLYADDVWGREKTDTYYSAWDKLENGQLCESGYFDLFLTSDGMIFDSISFIAEYLYVNKPGLFVMTNNRINQQLNDFGREAISRHYHAFNEEDIVNFAEKVILGSEDPEKGSREAFIANELCGHGSESAAESIYKEITRNI